MIRETAEAAGHAVEAQIGTILLVEDDVDLRSLARRALVRLGYRVLTAGDGEQALSLFREHEREIDLVLSDVGLPKLDGVGLVRAVRARNAGVKLLLSSGKAPTDLRVGEIQFIRKPWSLDELETAVRRAFGV